LHLSQTTPLGNIHLLFPIDSGIICSILLELSEFSLQKMQRIFLFWLWPTCR